MEGKVTARAGRRRDGMAGLRVNVAISLSVRGVEVDISGENIAQQGPKEEEGV